MKGRRKRALIIGATGQDGILLSRLLVGKGYQVLGTSRNPRNARPDFWTSCRGSVAELVQMLPSDFRSVFSVVNGFKPDEIYNLAGQTSVGVAFDQPVETMESISHSNLILLEVIRLLNSDIRYYNAISTEVFGNVPLGKCATEDTPLNPRSPYGVAKASAYWLVKNYRESYGLHLSNGILSNHESLLRPSHFVIPKIVEAANLISKLKLKKLSLGNVDIQRDWGWAEDYVEAMWLMLQMENSDDYVIGTGKTVSLSHVLTRVFENFGLDWRDFVVSEELEFRPSDIYRSAIDPSKANRLLGWRAKSDVDAVVDFLTHGIRHRRSGLTQLGEAPIH